MIIPFYPELFIKNADSFFLRYYQVIILTLLKKLFKKNLFIFIGFLSGMFLSK